ncbi:hypothetical protein SGPA1_10663 [Streptomyces misionensis JCM 4497]
MDDPGAAHARRRPRRERLRRVPGTALHSCARQPAPRRRHRPPTGVRRRRPGPRMAGGARHLRRRRAGERRPGRGRLRPFLLPGHQHHPARPLPQDGRRLGDPAPPRPGQRLDPLPARHPVADPRPGDRHRVPQGQQRRLGVGLGARRRGRRVARDPAPHPPPARHQPPVRPAGPGGGHPRPHRHIPRRRHLPAAPVRLADGGRRGPAGRAPPGTGWLNDRHPDRGAGTAGRRRPAPRAVHGACRTRRKPAGGRG